MKYIGLYLILAIHPFQTYCQLAEVEGILQISAGLPTLQFFDNGSGENRIEFKIQESGNDIFLRSLYGKLNLGASLTGTSNTHVTINHLGDVGLGVSDPLANLHLKDNFELLRLEGSSYQFLTFYRGGSKYGEMGFTTPNTKRLTIRNTNTGLEGLIQLLGGNGGGFWMFPDGKLYANNIGLIGNHKNMQWDATTGEIGWDGSSRRFKENIQSLSTDWSKIFHVRPVKYTRPRSPDRWEYGYIAEEMDSIGLTNLVGYDSDGIPDEVKYDRMVLYLTEIMKVHHQEIQTLKKKNEELHRIIMKSN